MKEIRLSLLIAFLFGFIYPLLAQPQHGSVEVSGKYGKFFIYIKYFEYEKGKFNIKGLELKYDGKELPKYINDLEKERDNVAQKLKTDDGELQKLKFQSEIQETRTDSILQRMDSLQTDKLQVEAQRDSLQNQVQLMNDSVRILKDSLIKVNDILADFYLKAQTPTETKKRSAKKGEGQHVGAYYRIGYSWMELAGLSHQCGLYWNSASISDKLPMAFGAGIEYYQIADSCLVSLPLSFSIGVPLTNRVCAFFQTSLAPSWMIEKNTQPYFVLLGRFAGGVYIPLCNTKKGKTSQWAVKLGANVDMGSAFNNDPKFYINPNLEVGILYIFKAKNK